MGDWWGKIERPFSRHRLFLTCVNHSQSNFIEIPIGFAITMGSVMSQRLLFRLRERYGDHARETSTSSRLASSRYGLPISHTSGSTTLQIAVSKDIELSTFR